MMMVMRFSFLPIRKFVLAVMVRVVTLTPPLMAMESLSLIGWNNVVDVVDVDRLTPELRKQYEDAIEEEYEYRAMVEAERRMGC